MQDPAQVMRRLVAVGDKVFVTIGLFAPVSMLDAATGAVVRTFNGTEGAFEILAQGNRLYLAVNSKLREARPGPDITLMAVDTDTGKILWKSAGHKGIWQTGKLSPQFVDAHITLGPQPNTRQTPCSPPTPGPRRPPRTWRRPADHRCALV